MIITVTAGQKLQAALDAAVPGDTLVLEAGATFTGNFILRNKTGDGTITIKSSNDFSGRVHPSDAHRMAKIFAPNTTQAIDFAPGAHDYTLQGLEIASPNSYTNNLIRIGYGTETTVEQLAQRTVIDQCYIHGDPTVGGKRGIGANCGEIKIARCYISTLMGFQDTQAICSWNGTGPFTIFNNYLESSGENVMFGGALPAIVGNTPADITVRFNHCKKLLEWKSDDPSFAGKAWPVKNLFELKNAKRVVVDGNVFENCWGSAQSGFALQFTVRDEHGTAPWAVVDDVLFQNNTIKNCDSGLNISGLDDDKGGELRQVRILNNVFGVKLRLFQLLNGWKDVTIDHNTGVADSVITHCMVLDGVPGSGLVFTNNICPKSTYGVYGSGSSEGIPSLTKFAPDAIFTGNVIVGGVSTRYPPGNFFPTTLVGVDLATYSNAVSGVTRV